MKMRGKASTGLTTSEPQRCRRASPSKRIVKNICAFICNRSVGLFTNSAGDILRKNMDIVKKLVCQKNTTFQNVWTKHSKSSINYTKGRIYFDNFRRCCNSVAAQPYQVYEMPRCSKLEKIEDALLCECPVGGPLPQTSDYTPSLMAVTGHNWLLRLSLRTGETLEKIYLGSYRKFRYITWDVPQETFVLKSIQKKSATMTQEAGNQGSVLFYLAAFKVFPFSLVGIMEINKHIFGSNVTDAMISHGMLIVMHSPGLVRLYSFERIVDQYMEQQLVFGQTCSWKGEMGTVGNFPFGIPCNITFTECPPYLFEVSCQDNAFQVGGFPWHYIITPNKKKEKGVYHVRSLADHSLAKNGILDMKCCSLEPDWIHFHPDASERIIHVGPNQINVLRLMELQNDSHQHQVIEEFVILATREKEVNNLVTITASGRVVKKRFNQLDDDPEQEYRLDVIGIPRISETIQCVRVFSSSRLKTRRNGGTQLEYKSFKIVIYEDELDLLTVVAVTQTEAEGKAHVAFHCNETGRLLKKIPLQESWDVTYSHVLFFDRDTLVHIEERPNRHFSCYVYKMLHSPAE